VLPLSIVGGIGLKISARIGYSQIWLHKTQVGQDWVQAPLQDELKLNHQQLIAEAPVEASAQGTAPTTISSPFVWTKGPDKLHLIIKSPDSMKRLSRPKVLPFGGWFSTSCCKGTCYRF